MFTRFLDAIRGRSDDRDAATAVVARGGVHDKARHVTYDGRAGHAPVRDPVLPHPSTMVEAWRQDVARATMALRDRFPAEAGDATTRLHVERLLVKLAVDLEMVVRQPPPAAQEALAAAADPECELPRLVQIVERDPTLARGLMRHASSAMFAAAGAPASIDDAVRRLGAKGVQIAVLAGMAESLMARGCGPYDPSAEQVWAHMVRVGPLARALARAFDVPAHEAFLFGLLHDIGKLVLFDVVGALQAELGRPVDVPPALGLAALADLHEPLGGLALLRWGVDPRAAWAVAHHHRRLAPAEPDRRSELLFVAERLDRALAKGETPAVDQWFADGWLTAARDKVSAAVARVREAGGALN